MRRGLLLLALAALCAAAPAPAALGARLRSPYVGAVAADAGTGNVLFSDRADAEAYPASVTKLMTALLVLEDVKAGRYSLKTPVAATAEAKRSEPSWMNLAVGQRTSVDGLLAAMLVNSANDAAIALAVNSSGSHAAFVARMNARAATLGMSRTRYYNANGLPPNAERGYPWKDFNRTTAEDQLKLAREILKNHPEILRYTSIRELGAAATALRDGDGRPYPLRSHNRIMLRGGLKASGQGVTTAVDGLKTGYIKAGGSSIVLTGTRNGKRAVVVVLGSTTADERDAQASRLLDDALGALSW